MLGAEAGNLSGTPMQLFTFFPILTVLLTRALVINRQLTKTTMCHFILKCN